MPSRSNSVHFTRAGELVCAIILTTKKKPGPNDFEPAEEFVVKRCLDVHQHPTAILRSGHAWPPSLDGELHRSDIMRRRGCISCYCRSSIWAIGAASPLRMRVRTTRVYPPLRPARLGAITSKSFFTTSSDVRYAETMRRLCKSPFFARVIMRAAVRETSF